jgi:uncharacterized DUF497 family protein
MSASDFEWDDAKRTRNIELHGIDFRDVPQVFDGPHLVQPSSRTGEERLLAIGFLQSREVTVVYTLRNGRLRIISARRASRYERKALQDALSRQS